MTGDDGAAQLQKRERHTALNPPLELEELEMHVDGVGEFRVLLAQEAQLTGLP
jgi:hypothetical protein